MFFFYFFMRQLKEEVARKVTQDLSLLGFGRSMEKIQARENVFFKLR